MQAEDAMLAMARDEDQFLVAEIGAPRVSAGRMLPMLGGALLLVAGAGLGAKAVFSFRDDEVTSLQAWRSRPSRTDVNGCTWDGDSCMSSKCCAKEGSRCWVKNRHWASCNETCSHNVKWGAGVDRRGYWAVTHTHVWDCIDLTADGIASTPAVVETTAKVVETTAKVVETTAKPAETTVKHRTFSLYDDDVGPTSQVVEYPKAGDRSQVVSSTAIPASTTAAVRWHSV